MGKFFEGVYEQLRIFVRFSAWLSATPEAPANEHRALKDKAKPAEPLTRLAKMRADMKDEEFLPDMPDVDVEVVYLLTYLWEIGPVHPGGMGPVPIPQTEIVAWQSNNGIDLQPWEVRHIRNLSIDYLHQHQKSKKADEPAPWESESVERTRAVKAKQIKNLFRS